MARIYAFANQKGGVGKTTTAVSLAAYLANAGRRLLIVDADPQANATTSLGVNSANLHHSLYDVLIGRVSLSQTIVPVERPQMDLVPSAPELAGAEVEMVSIIARERLLSKALQPVAHLYDYVFIDTPPSLGLLTINALTAADDGVIIPIQCEYLALEGLSHLLYTIQLVRDNLNPRLRVAGMVLTMFDARTNLAKEVVEEVRRHFPRQVFQTVIPRSVRLGEAPSYGEPILAYAPHSAGAQAYWELTREFLQRERGLSVPTTR
ncbi:MAG: ParA family protein [Anaerolineae bacterium]|nr:ParA family protein [Anaerolineae bacterium]